MVATEPIAVDPEDPVMAEMILNAGLIVSLDEQITEAVDTRNQLWSNAMQLGYPAALCGAPYGLTAQAVRWNLKQITEGTPPKARTGSKRGLKTGSRPKSGGKK